MYCPRCNAPNDTDSRFCKNCGLAFYQYQPVQPAPVVSPVKTDQKDKSLEYLIIILALFCFQSLFYKFLDKIVAPIINRGYEYGEGMSTIYDICSWAFNLITITLSVIFLIKVKNKVVRILLIVYAAIFFVNLIQYDILPLFEKKNPYIYFKF